MEENKSNFYLCRRCKRVVEEIFGSGKDLYCGSCHTMPNEPIKMMLLKTNRKENGEETFKAISKEILDRATGLEENL